jgi:4-amino-4-deoxy-L-arabinose transferase-like glycosyltransferase
MIVAGLFFMGLGRYPLLDPDEARHAEVAREMATGTGVRRLFLPTLELEPYREKPAPFYWLIMLAYRVGGVEAGAARAVSATAALVAVLAVYAFAVPRHGPAGALAAALVLATSGGWLALARFVNLDMTLTVCVVVGVLAGLAWLDRGPPRRPPLVPYLAAALATLVKGPLGAVLVLGPLALALLLRRPRPRFGELGLVRGVALAGLVVAAFWLPVALLDASYATRFVTTNLRRFGTESPHAAPVWYYVVWLPALLLPWTLLAPAVIVRAARDPGQRALLLWAAFVPALLTLARGKLATYALSALVPLALIVGPELARTVRTGPPREDEPALKAGGWLAALVLISAAPAILALRVRFPISLFGALLLGGVALAWAITVVRLLRCGPLSLLPAAVLGAMLTLAPLLAHFVAPAVATLHSDREAARLIAATDARAPVIAYAARAPSLVFYLRAPVIRTEDPTVVRDLFAGDGPVFLVAGHRHFETIEGLLGAHAHRWHGTARRRLYANRPPPAAQERNGSE